MLQFARPWSVDDLPTCQLASVSQTFRTCSPLPPLFCPPAPKVSYEVPILATGTLRLAKAICSLVRILEFLTVRSGSRPRRSRYPREPYRRNFAIFSWEAFTRLDRGIAGIAGIAGIVGTWPRLLFFSYLATTRTRKSICLPNIPQATIQTRPRKVDLLRQSINLARRPKQAFRSLKYSIRRFFFAGTSSGRGIDLPTPPIQPSSNRLSTACFTPQTRRASFPNASVGFLDYRSITHRPGVAHRTTCTTRTWTRIVDSRCPSRKEQR
jgi:hypothetical protein